MLTLPQQIKNDLLARIISGEIRPEERLPSEASLAADFGVSRMTARQALVEMISEGILLRIPGKGTFVNKQASLQPSINGKTDNLISLIVPNLRLSFFFQIIYGVEKTLVKNDCELLLRSVGEDRFEERKYLRKLLDSDIKGLVLVAGDDSFNNSDILRELMQRVPVIIVDADVPGVETDRVISDSRDGACQITEHLIELGHRRILHLAGECKSDSHIGERLTGYREALAKHDIDYQPELIRFTGWHAEEGYSETKKFLLGNSGSDRPSAIFACNDEVAIGAYRALKELNIRVPEDMALVGYGNLDISRLFETSLTTVEQYPARMGSMAAHMLLDRLQDPDRAAGFDKVVIPTRLIVRKSCGIGLKDVGEHLKV